MKTYQHEKGSIGHFVDECCVVANDATVSAPDLYRAYQKWGGQQSNTTFGREISGRFEKHRAKSGIRYRGVGLSAQSDASVISSSGVSPDVQTPINAESLLDMPLGKALQLMERFDHELAPLKEGLGRLIECYLALTLSHEQVERITQKLESDRQAIAAKFKGASLVFAERNLQHSLQVTRAYGRLLDVLNLAPEQIERFARKLEADRQAIHAKFGKSAFDFSEYIELVRRLG